MGNKADSRESYSLLKIHLKGKLPQGKVPDSFLKHQQ